NVPPSGPLGAAPAQPVPLGDGKDAATRVTIAGPEASPITFDRMGRWPEPGWQVPRSIAFSPDGHSITFLQSEKENDETSLFAFDRQSKAVRVLVRAGDLSATSAPLSREEALRRERERAKKNC